MAIDLDALGKVASGDPNSRITVRRGWLADVHRQLLEAKRLETKDKLASVGERLISLRD